jgi:hypothetical protein
MGDVSCAKKDEVASKHGSYSFVYVLSDDASVFCAMGFDWRGVGEM